MDLGIIYTWTYSIIMLVSVFVVGFLVARAPLVRKFYLPTALVAGLILLILGPQIMGNVSSEFQLSKAFYGVWKGFPKVLINVVFACLFIAHPMMPLKKIWKTAGPQVAFGQMLAWGQYLVAGIVTMLILMPAFGMPNITAALLEISFEGGHGTVAGMSGVFSKFGFENGQDLANGLATASLVSSLLFGLVLIHRAKKRGYLNSGGVIKVARNKVYYQKIVHDLHDKGVRLRDHLTFGRVISNVAVVTGGVGLGFLIHWLLSQLEELTWGKAGIKIMSFLPHFTFCMIGGMLIGEFVRKIGFKISRTVIDLVSAVSLSGLIMTAIGTMSLSFLSSDFAVFGILYLAGTIWLLGCFVLLARRMFREYWFQNAIISFGQSMGMTATGLLFAQMVDPKNRTNAVESFGYKQLLFEPFMGGGIVTALSIPIISAVGLPIFTLVCGVITVGWMIFGILKFGGKK